VACILFLTHVLPYPLHSGAKIRAYYVLRHLTQQHEVTLVSFVREDDRPEYIAHLERFCRAVYTVPMRRSLLRDARALIGAGLTRRPVIIVRDEISEMHATLKRLVKEGAFEVVHADQTSMAQYALYARSQIPNLRSRQRVGLLLDAHNALYRIPERLAAHERNPLKRLLLRHEARALARYEAGLWKRFDHVVFVADQDRQALQEQISNLPWPTRQPVLPAPCRDGAPVGAAQVAGPGGRQYPIPNIQYPIPDTPPPSTTIPICVDPEEQALIPRVQYPRTITHLGTMFWPPNIEGVLWFAYEVLPHVLAQVPEVQFVIIGKNPPEEIRTLALQNPNIQVTGYVANPTPHLAETAVFIVPLRAGGGMRVKIPDAWCWGVPVISTSIGAEGTDAQHGSNALIADTPEDLAAEVVRVLQNPALGEQLRDNGRRWVEERYNWRKVYNRWDEVYERLVDER
jgi:glycosyltransferase involved in cell wall biosynthesis